MLAFGRLGLARVLAQVLGVDLEREVARLRPLQVVQVAHLVESEGGESALLVCYHQRQTFTTNTVKYSQIQSNTVKYSQMMLKFMFCLGMPTFTAKYRRIF